MTAYSEEASTPDAVQNWIRSGAPAQDLQALVHSIRRLVDADPSSAERVLQSLADAQREGTIDATVLRCVSAELASATRLRRASDHTRERAQNGSREGGTRGPDPAWLSKATVLRENALGADAHGHSLASTVWPHVQKQTSGTKGTGESFSASWQPPAPPGPAMAREIGIGTVLNGHYRLDDLIGSGGMGQVWRARDLIKEYTHDPRPDVAIKLLRQDFESHPDAFISFSREASRSQQLAHPNILTVHDFAMDAETGRAFMTMELLEGEPLDRVISSHPAGLPRERALPIIRGIATGLAYAHRKRFIHCDIKPGNVFLQPEDIPKVLDFGIARVSRVADASANADSFDAGRLGALSPPYATIEMIDGDQTAEPHPADDVYALGLVAYELLTGKHPYTRRSAREASDQQLKVGRIPGVSRRESQTILKAIALRREERWQDADSFLRALEGRNAKLIGTASVAVVLAAVAASFGYETYLAAQPAVPFGQLPAEAQAGFTTAVGEGRRLLEFSSRVHGFEGTYTAQAALAKFAEAYQIHPRNADADKGLRDTLDRLEPFAASNDPAVREGLLDTLKKALEEHDALKGFRPLEKMIDRLEADSS